MTTATYRIVRDQDYLGPPGKLPKDVKRGLYEALPDLQANDQPGVKRLDDRLSVRIPKDEAHDWVIVCIPRPDHEELRILSCLTEENAAYEADMRTAMSSRNAATIERHLEAGPRTNSSGGAEYIDNIRWIWRGFLPDGATDS